MLTEMRNAYKIDDELSQYLDNVCAEKVATTNGIIDFDAIKYDSDLTKEFNG